MYVYDKIFKVPRVDERKILDFSQNKTSAHAE